MRPRLAAATARESSSSSVSRERKSAGVVGWCLPMCRCSALLRRRSPAMNHAAVGWASDESNKKRRSKALRRAAAVSCVGGGLAARARESASTRSSREEPRHTSGAQPLAERNLQQCFRLRRSLLLRFLGRRWRDGRGRGAGGRRLGGARRRRLPAGQRTQDSSMGDRNSGAHGHLNPPSRECLHLVAIWQSCSRSHVQQQRAACGVRSSEGEGTEAARERESSNSSSFAFSVRRRPFASPHAAAAHTTLTRSRHHCSIATMARFIPSSIWIWLGLLVVVSFVVAAVPESEGTAEDSRSVADIHWSGAHSLAWPQSRPLLTCTTRLWASTGAIQPTGISATRARMDGKYRARLRLLT